MGYRRVRWKHHPMLRLAFPWRYSKKEGSKNLTCSTGANCRSESICKGPFTAPHGDVVVGNQEWTVGSRYVDATGGWGEAYAVFSDSPHCDVEFVSKTYGELCQQQQQSCPDLSRAVFSFYNLPHRRLPQHVSRFSRSIYTRPLARHAESSTIHADVAMLDGIHESKRTAEQQAFTLNVTVKNVNEILSREGWERALGQFNLHICTQLVCEVIRRQSNVNAALAFFQWARGQQGFQHRGRTYKAMLQKLMKYQDFKSRNLDTFHLIMNESLQNGWSPGVTIHTYLIDGYCKLGRVDEAFDHFYEMVSHGCAPNVVTYSSLIGGLLKVGRIQVALSLLEDMEERKCYPNVITYSVLIHGLVKHRQLDEAWKIFNRMKKQGCTPNLITYSSLVDGVTREGKFEEISKLLDQMRETRCVPSLFIYGTVINYFVKAGKLQKAWDLFIEMKQIGIEPNLFVYTPLMTSLGKAGKWEKAQELLAEMRFRRCDPDVVTYSSLIAGLVRAGKWKEGIQVLDQMGENGCHPNEVTYTILIDGLVKARQADMAQALFRKMVANGCTTTILNQDALGKVLARIRAKQNSKF